MVKKFNLNGKNQKREKNGKDQNHQNVKNVELYGKDQNQNVLSVKQNYLNLTLKNSRNHQSQNQVMVHHQVVLLLKMKEKKKKLQKKKKKNLNLKNQNAQVAKRNYLSSGECMDIDMDLEDMVNAEKVKEKKKNKTINQSLILFINLIN